VHKIIFQINTEHSRPFYASVESSYYSCWHVTIPELSARYHDYVRHNK